jgi:hypothetical protein
MDAPAAVAPAPTARCAWIPASATALRSVRAGSAGPMAAVGIVAPVPTTRHARTLGNASVVHNARARCAGLTAVVAPVAPVPRGRSAALVSVSPKDLGAPVPASVAVQEWTAIVTICASSSEPAVRTSALHVRSLLHASVETGRADRPRTAGSAPRTVPVQRVRRATRTNAACLSVPVESADRTTVGEAAASVPRERPATTAVCANVSPTAQGRTVDRMDAGGFAAPRARTREGHSVPATSVSTASVPSWSAPSTVSSRVAVCPLALNNRAMSV